MLAGRWSSLSLLLGQEMREREESLAGTGACAHIPVLRCSPSRSGGMCSMPLAGEDGAHDGHSLPGPLALLLPLPLDFFALLQHFEAPWGDL